MAPTSKGRSKKARTIKGGHKSYECSDCGRGFQIQSDLRKHEKRHAKPHECGFTDCQKSFSTENDLKRHRASVHSVYEKSFRCYVEDCKSKDKDWTRKDNFITHLKRVHKWTDVKKNELNKFLHNSNVESRVPTMSTSPPPSPEVYSQISIVEVENRMEPIPQNHMAFGFILNE